MKEPTFDKDGYPTEETLQAIREWNPRESKECFEFIGKAWSYPDLYVIKKYTVDCSTGGWSGNESLIGALEDNIVIWSMRWFSSKRGGHYVFTLPVIRS